MVPSFLIFIIIGVTIWLGQKLRLEEMNNQKQNPKNTLRQRNMASRAVGSGLSFASTLNEALLALSHEANQPVLETLCKKALTLLEKQSIVANFEKLKTAKKCPDKNVMDMFNTMSSKHKQNHAMRFDLDDGSRGGTLLAKKDSNFNLKMFSGGGEEDDDYENITSRTVIDAPITDICIVQRGEPVPEGFFRLSKTQSNKKANLNAHSGGNHIFLCIKKDNSSGAVPITAMTGEWRQTNGWLWVPFFAGSGRGFPFPPIFRTDLPQHASIDFPNAHIFTYCLGQIVLYHLHYSHFPGQKRGGPSGLLRGPPWYPRLQPQHRHLLGKNLPVLQEGPYR